MKDLLQRQKLENNKDDEKLDEDELQKLSVKNRNKIVIVTPATAQYVYQKGLLKNQTCFSLVVDKINMHQAFDLE